MHFAELAEDTALVFFCPGIAFGFASRTWENTTSTCTCKAELANIFLDRSGGTSIGKTSHLASKHSLARAFKKLGLLANRTGMSLQEVLSHCIFKKSMHFCSQAQRRSTTRFLDAQQVTVEVLLRAFSAYGVLAVSMRLLQFELERSKQT